MKKINGIITALLLCTLLSGCGKEASRPAETTAGNNGENETPKVEMLLSEMTLEEKVWQMFFVAPEDIIDGIDIAVMAGDATREAIESCRVGGIIYFSQNIESRDQISQMTRNTQSYSKIPLFIAVDEEGGRVARLGNAGIIKKLPPMAEIGAMGEAGIEEAEKNGEFLGAELSELGFNMDFAPVADVITVENNEDIGDRSFGTDPELVAKMVAAEVTGLQGKNVSATLKHFPSNGSAAENTHYDSAVCTRTIEEMRECEFIPFKAGIEAGADVVMVAHMAAVNLTGDETPSTFSPIIIQDYLRGELGFSKVVITDALNMGAVTNAYSPEEAALAAVSAGADMLLMSENPKIAAQSVIQKVQSGEISEERIDESVRRILELKERRGIL